MERVYLLLRNNVQTGPFTIGELWQQQLRPSDMIWIEGKSTAWTYLTELELIPFVKNPVEPEQNTPVRSTDEIEAKAELLRQKILASAPKAYMPRHEVEIETFTSPYKLPEGELHFVDHRKERRIRKNTVLGEVLLTCFVIGLFVLGLYKGKSFLGVRDKVQNSVATELSSGDQHAAQKSGGSSSSSPVSMGAAAKDSILLHDSLLALQKARPKSSNRKIVTDSAALQLPVAAMENTEEVRIEPPLQLAEENANTVKKQDTPLKKEVLPPGAEVKTENGAPKEEKKGFLKNLFKKKSKEETAHKGDKE